MTMWFWDDLCKEIDIGCIYIGSVVMLYLYSISWEFYILGQYISLDEIDGPGSRQWFNGSFIYFSTATDWLDLSM